MVGTRVSAKRLVPWGLLGAVAVALALAWTFVPPIVFRSAARELWDAYTAKANAQPATDLRQGMTYAEATTVAGEPDYTERALMTKDSSGELKAVAAIAVWSSSGDETRALFIDNALVEARTGSWPVIEQ